MKIRTAKLQFNTRGKCEIVNLTERAETFLKRSKMSNGILTLFVPGSTGALTTIEFDQGLRNDFPRIMERIVPENYKYLHDDKWGDGNGHSHIRASLIGPTLVLPFFNKIEEVLDNDNIKIVSEENADASPLKIGDAQQIVFIDFDIKPRVRTVYIQAMGEE